MQNLLNNNSSNDSSDNEVDNENTNEKDNNEDRSDSEHDFSPSKHNKKIKSKCVVDDTEFNSSSDDESVEKSKKRTRKVESETVKISKSTKH